MAFKYQPATTPSGGPTPGALALRDYARSLGFGDAGIYNNRPVRGGTSLSVHAEGRAIDITMGRRSVADLTAFINQLIANPALGIQQVIWQRQYWRPDTGWRPYRGVNPHTDHAHIELTREAAGSLTVESFRTGVVSTRRNGLGQVVVTEDPPVPIAIPKDGVVVRDTRHGGRYVLYHVKSADLMVFFALDDGVDWDIGGMEDWDRYYLGVYDVFSDPRVIHTTRSARELQGIAQNWGSFENWYNHLMNVYIRNEEARQDKGVQRLIMEMSFRPDMSEAEFRARLQDTEYYRSRNDKQREWNDLSPAEQNARVEDMRARLAEEYWQLVGTMPAATDPQLLQWAREVASGNMGYGAVIDAIRGIARRNPESPWSRTLRNEEENQRQRGIDISNMGGRIRSEAERWGVQLQDAVVRDWSDAIVSKRRSEADLIEYLKNQSKLLYPHKDRDVTAVDYGQAWRAVYESVLEQPEVSIFNPDIQRAMQANMPLADFERELKRRPEWLNTTNAYDSLARNAAKIGDTMGFV